MDRQHFESNRGDINAHLVLDNQATDIDIIRAHHAGRAASVAIFDLPGTARHVLPRRGLGWVEDGVAGTLGTLQFR